MNTVNKNTLVSIALALIVIAIIWVMTPPFVKPVITLTLSKSNVPITDIFQSRDVGEVRTHKLDKINLHQSNRFSHPKLGPLGWSENFFADIDMTFTLEKAGRYRFVVGSDDGFSLKVNNKELCRFVRDRPYRKQTCPVTLDAGEHHLLLSYFQGYGLAGLTLEFAPADGGKRVYWGERLPGLSYTTAQ
ncbi:MAG TPA: serine protease [Cellvibrionaceae bacterium]